MLCDRFPPIGIVQGPTIAIEKQGGRRILMFKSWLVLGIIPSGPSVRVEFFGIFPGKLLDHQIFFGIKGLGSIGAVLHHAKIYIIGNSSFPHSSFFCGNQYYPVGSPCTIYSSGGCILQHFYGDYLARVQIIDRRTKLILGSLRQLYSIHHIQWVVGGVNGTESPDPNIGLSSRTTRVGIYLYPGDLARQGLVKGGGRTFAKFLLVYGTDRTG